MFTPIAYDFSYLHVFGVLFYFRCGDGLYRTCDSDQDPALHL